MNVILQSLQDRKSVRVFEHRKIEAAEKREILNAALQAPTAGKQQLYTILDITDQALKDGLAESCDHQPFIATAPVVLIFCADFQKWYDVFVEGDCHPRSPGVGDLMLAVSDAVIAAQNAVVAAESLGIGSCYIGDIMENCQLHRAMLGLPPFVFPAAMLVMGYPTQQQKDRAKPARYDLSYMVQENGYHRMDGTQLRRMFQKDYRNNRFEDWIGAFCQRKYNADFSQEMTRSVAEYLEAFQSK